MVKMRYVTLEWPLCHPITAFLTSSSSSSYCLQYALHMRSIIYCFGGVCAAASTILVVAIAKF